MYAPQRQPNSGYRNPSQPIVSDSPLPPRGGEEDGHVDLLQVVWHILFPGIPYPVPSPGGTPPTVPERNSGGVMHMNAETTDTFPLQTVFNRFPSPDVPAPTPSGGDAGGVLGTVFNILLQVGTVVGSVYLAKKMMEAMNAPPPPPNIIFVNNGGEQSYTEAPLQQVDYLATTKAVQEKMSQLVEIAQQELDKAMLANYQAAQGNTGVMRTIAGAGMPTQNQPGGATRYPASEAYSFPTSTGQSVPSPLDPAKTGGNTPFIQEDQAFIQRNLGYAQKPMTMGELARLQAENRRVVQQQQLMAQQQRTLAEQERLAREQRLALNRPYNYIAPEEIRARDVERSKEQPYLNQRQQMLNQLFGKGFFSRTELQYPFDHIPGQGVVPDSNIARGIAIADWILKGQYTGVRKASWNDAELADIKKRLASLTDEQNHQLTLAAKLHQILKANEENGSKRDDAKAFAQGVEAVIQANTVRGKVDEEKFIEDMRFFFIDQPYDALGIPIKFYSGIKTSNAAYNLGGGPRLGSLGWDKKYWDSGQLYDSQGRPINQAHHFTAFFTEALKTQDLHALRTWTLNTYAKVDTNPQDKALANLAIDMANLIKFKRISWEILPERIYNEIKP